MVKDFLIKQIPTAYAESIINESLNEPATDAAAVVEFIQRLTTMVASAAGGIAVAMIIYGAIVLITASGNEERVGKGKKILTYAIGGVILVLASYALITIFIRLLGGEVKSS